MKCPFIGEHRGQYCLERLCQALEVSLRGYYAWISRPESPRQQENNQIVREIKEIHRQSRQSYDSPRIYHELKAKGVAISENKAARLILLNGIVAK